MATTVSFMYFLSTKERTFELWMLSRGCNVVYSTIRTFKKDLALHKPHWAVLVPRVLEKIAVGVQEKFSTSGGAVKVLSSFFTSVGKTYSTNAKIVSGLIVADAPTGPLERIGAKIALSAVKPLHAIGQKLVWSKVKEGFGGRLKVIISGGSALAGGLETFYETAGLTICVGYGLTECSPLLAFRRKDSNLVTGGCIGKACIDTEIRIVDPEAKANGDKPRQAVPIGQVGVVLGRGPQVMKGYYKNPEATAKAIDKFGWFDTGDLGRINPATGDIILTGRVKDTIVLSNGENIEPVPIEDAIMGDIPLVDQVMVTTASVGGEGDGKNLIAITVLNPQALYDNGFLKDADQLKRLQEAVEAVNSPQCSIEDYGKYSTDILLPTTQQLRSNPDAIKFLTQSVKDVLTTAGKFRKWELVQDFCITMEPFAMVNGQLTQSYKVKRAQVAQRYQNEL
jgi:long-chain acyl-CoA synthetase